MFRKYFILLLLIGQTLVFGIPKIEITKTIVVNGLSRSFMIYIPETASSQSKMPLLFVLHGGTGNPEGMMKIANFKPISDREKVILVYPAGMTFEGEKGGSWNDGRPTPAHENGVDDVAFFSAMIDEMVANFNVDASRVYVTGISNGGFMSSRLGSELSSKITAFAAVAASEEVEIASKTTSSSVSRQVPAMFIQGTSDKLVPFEGGNVKVGIFNTSGTVLSHLDVVAKWVLINSCTIIPITTEIPDINTSDKCKVTKKVYNNAETGVEVVSFVIIGGGHTWPHGPQYLPIFVVGRVNKDLNACEEIWSFFKKYKI